MKRRDFLKTTSLTLGSTALGQLVAGQIAAGQVAAAADRTEPLVGVQIAPVSIFDEGIDRCLDTLKEKANVNALFIYSQTYHAGTTPSNVLATDHGVPVRDFFKSRLPRLWVRHQPTAFAGKVVQHQTVSSDLEYGDRDLFREIQEPARQRGMKVYARILEADARRKDFIPGYERVLSVDHEGKPGHGPCWNNPHYRDWVYTTIRELVTNYRLDGLQYGAERSGPLSDVLYRGIAPACFCQFCIDRNKEQGIDASRAKEGFTKLLGLIRNVEHGKTPPTDGLLTSLMRIVYRHPEVLSWDYQWFQASDEICAEVHRIAKQIRPEIDSGRHEDHQRSSWDFFYRAATNYEQMAEHADFIKPIVYHESMGPRLRWWVLQRMKQGVLSELSMEQSLELFYSVFGHDSSRQPSLEELDATGLGPEYIYREIHRCKQAVQNKARVYAGIGIDIPWYVENGMEPRPSDPDQLIAAVHRAFDAGADGILASREYNEMRMPSLEAFGQAVSNR